MFKKLLILLAIGGIVAAIVQQRKQAAEAESRLWDEAVGNAGEPTTTPGAATSA